MNARRGAPQRVRLAVSMGDPAGIGPEVALKAITASAVASQVEPVLVGDPGVWRDTARRLGLSMRFGVHGQRCPPGTVPIAITSELGPRHRVPGAPRGAARRAACGTAAHAAIVEAVRLVQAGCAAGVVTAPISKAHLAAAGLDFPGHTELLAQLCGGVPVRMMMVGGSLRVVLVTIHMALAEVPRRVTQDGVLQTLTLAAQGLRQWFRIAAPRLAVTGLNPHAGENGLFGDEEARVISPAIRAGRRRGLHVSGPLAADGLFAQESRGGYDALICMYHDQGLAPFKTLHFADGVNFTLGLPFVRTSPDHGTAFDLAGSGRADPRSMIAALCVAAHTAKAAAQRPLRMRASP